MSDGLSLRTYCMRHFNVTNRFQQGLTFASVIIYVFNPSIFRGVGPVRYMTISVQWVDHFGTSV